ncbi:MAG: ATP-binding protein [Pseudomonadota bacterium]
MSDPAPSPARVSLGAYLAAAFSLMSILLTMVLVLVIERTASVQVEKSIGANLAELAHQTATRLDRAMFERYREVGLIANRLGSQASPIQVRAELEALQVSYPYYAWIGATDLEGKVRASTGGLLTGQDVSKRPWFSNALDGKYVGDVHEALLLAKLLGPAPGSEPPRFVDVAFPVRDPAGRAVGVLGAHLSWEWARDIQRVIFVAVDSERDVEPLIVSESGSVLLGPQDMNGRKLATASIQAAAAGTAGYGVETWPDGVSYLVGHASTKGHRDYPGLGWKVLVRQPVSEAFEPVRELQRRVFGGGVVIALLFSLLGWYAAKVITRPVLRLADEASRMETHADLPTAATADYREVGQLGDALGQMLRKLRARETELRDLNTSLEQRVEERTTELRSAMADTRQNEQRIRTIIESAQDPFIGMDLDGRITDWNMQAQKLFGWTREEILGRQLAQTLVPGRFGGYAQGALDNFVRTGENLLDGRAIERWMVDRHGREIPVEVRIGLVDTGPSKFFCAFVHDISQRREIERLKNEFVATVSHELRTPLTAIYGSLNMLESGMAGELSEDARELVTMSYKSCERLVRLINDVLDVEKIDAGLLDYVKSVQPLQPLLAQSAGDMVPYAAQHGVSLRMQRELDAQVDVDADRIVQVLVNLLSNAVKYSPSGGIVVCEAAVTGDVVRVSVVDNGPGIPQEFRARVFERFAQADGSDRRQKGGTGLGLNICKNIVEAHGGRIGFESEPGVRTEFYFELPLVS